VIRGSCPERWTFVAASNNSASNYDSPSKKTGY
jgi:hypothetical protein